VPFPINLPSPEMDIVRASMRELLHMILDFFEEELRKVEAELLAEEDTLLYDLELQENNTDTEPIVRPIPENFKRLRA
jgi:hypothetical protein